MLFDLRSRGRRRTVQVIYLGLAILIGGGLVLFGVGSGTGGGGLLNGIGGNGSAGNQASAISRQAASAQKVAERNPNSASAWSALVSADYAASQQAGALTSSGTYTAAGKRYLTATVAAWEHYTQLNKNPGTDISILAARAYGGLGLYAQEASAWENVIQNNPNQAKGYECLAASAYAAKQNRKGDLAAAKAESLVTKLQRLSLKQALAEAKTNPSVAALC